MLIRQLEKVNTKLKLKNVETLACYDDFEWYNKAFLVRLYYLNTV